MDLKLEKDYGAFIGGQSLAVTGETFPAINPATGEHLAEIARCGKEHIDQAVKAARDAFVKWAGTSYETRSRTAVSAGEQS